MKRRLITPFIPILVGFLLLVALLWLSAETQAAVGAKAFSGLTLAESPAITEVEPNSAPNDEQTLIVVQGSGFSATITGTQVLAVPTVYLGEVELPDVIWVSTTTLNATVPWKLPAQVYALTVVNPDGAFATLPDAFTVIDNLPSLASMDPNSAPNDLDTEVVIHGDKIGAVISDTEVITPPTVYIGDKQIQHVTWVDATTLEGVVPWGLPADTYTLTVVNPNGISATLPSAFTAIDGLNEFNTGGPYGGVTKKLKLKPGNPDTVYALMFGAGLFISEDGADSWKPIHDHDWLLQLDFDAGDPNTLYLGADSNDLYRSDDNGASWVRISDSFHTLNGCFTTYPVAHPTDPGKVYFGMGSCGDMYLESDEGGVYFSNNYGAFWSERNNGLSDRDIQVIAIDPHNPDRLTAGTINGKLFKTINGGSNWTEITYSFNGSITQYYFNPYVVNDAWAITSSDSDGRGYLYHSTDPNLEVWTPINIDVAKQGPFQAQMDFQPGSVWLASGSVLQSTDGSQTWDPVNNPHWYATALAISPNDPQILYVGTDYGVELSSDGGSIWTEMIEGLAAMVPNAMAVSSMNPDIVYVKTHQGIYISQNGGYDWQYLDYGSGGFTGRNSLAVDPFNQEKLYFIGNCEDEFCIDISMDGGISWNYVTSLLPPGYAGWSCSSFTILPSPHTENHILVGASLTPPGGGDVESIFFTSSNGGANWSYVVPHQTLGRVQEMAYDAINPDLVYAATDGTGLWRSVNGGGSWASVPVANETNISVSAIAVHPNLTNKVYVRTYDFNEGPNPEPELWFSENAGANWHSMSEVFTGADLLMAPPVPDQILYSLYTGCELGLCRTFDDGSAWDSVTGMPRPRMLSAASDGERSIIYLGTPGGLVYNPLAQGLMMTDALPGLGSLGGAGIYRLVSAIQSERIYLPLAFR